MPVQSIELRGLAEIQKRVALLGDRLKPGALRRPGVEIAKALVASNRSRLARGVDVNGRALRTGAAVRRGLKPLGGGDGLFARSVRAQPFTSGGDGVDIYSTFIGADVAYKGKEIRPKTAKYLTVPLEAKGGEGSETASGGFASAGLSLFGNTTGRRARHYDNTFFLEDDGRLFIAQRDKRVKGKNTNRIRFLFLLIRRMRYPQNEWLGASEGDMSMAAETYGRHLDTFAA